MTGATAAAAAGSAKFETGAVPASRARFPRSTPSPAVRRRVEVRRAAVGAEAAEERPQPGRLALVLRDPAAQRGQVELALEGVPEQHVPLVLLLEAVDRLVDLGGSPSRAASAARRRARPRSSSSRRKRSCRCWLVSSPTGWRATMFRTPRMPVTQSSFARSAHFPGFGRESPSPRPARARPRRPPAGQAPLPRRRWRLRRLRPRAELPHLGRGPYTRGMAVAAEPSKNLVGGEWLEGTSGEMFESRPGDGESLGSFPARPPRTSTAPSRRRKPFEEWRLVPAPSAARSCSASRCSATARTS